MTEGEDNVRIDPRLTKIGLQALAAVSEKRGVDFFDLDLEGKKKFLNDFGSEVVELARTCSGRMGRYFENRVVMLVESEGTAGLYFVKKTK